MLSAALIAASTAVACVATPLSAQQAAPHLAIDTSDIVHPVSPTLYGMMTEEINHSYDGGLYAEQIQNRTFRADWAGISHWDLVRRGEAKASMAIDKTNGPSTALPYSMELTVDAASVGNEAGVSNSGFWGINAQPHTLYRGSFYAHVDVAPGPVTVQLVNDRSGAVLAEASVPLHKGQWSQYSFTLHTGEIVASTENHLQLTVAQPGKLRLQLVSLMPPTFHDRPNGNRADLMERMAALHPHFLRMPGGNYLEGDELRDWFNWKETIGPLVDRPGHQGPWRYWSTDGVGLLEFLEWCEDLKMEPLLAVYAGYSLKGEHIQPGKDLEPFVQSAIDEVEYVTGDASTRWGAMRARDGHPAPFPLHYIEIGNEDEFDKSKSYNERFAQFAHALHSRYPQYQLIATTRVNEKHADEQPDLIDDHYYKPVGAMLDFTHRYDDAPRTGPKIFVGEWATLSGSPTPDFGGALADAAWMTSMERNSDLIVMASYAPLLVNVNPSAGQWGTNMIGYDVATTYGSPSYYAQSLFAGHLGDGTPRSAMTGAGDRFYYSVSVSSATQVLHLKLVNASSNATPLTIDLQAMKGKRTAKLTTLHANTYQATNSLTAPNAIHPVDSTLQVTGPTWHHTVPPLTIEVIDVPLR